MKGKNKLVPRLLGNHHLNQEHLLILNRGFLLFQTLQPHITLTTSGITKENVMRVDERTKEVLQVWQLTTVRRWAASPNSFTLDFGDYSENYYSVQTQVNSCSEASYFIIRWNVDIGHIILCHQPYQHQTAQYNTPSSHRKVKRSLSWSPSTLTSSWRTSTVETVDWVRLMKRLWWLKTRSHQVRSSWVSLMANRSAILGNSSLKICKTFVRTKWD